MNFIISFQLMFVLNKVCHLCPMRIGIVYLLVRISIAHICAKVDISTLMEVHQRHTNVQEKMFGPHQPVQRTVSVSTAWNIIMYIKGATINRKTVYHGSIRLRFGSRFITLYRGLVHSGNFSSQWTHVFNSRWHCNFTKICFASRSCGCINIFEKKIYSYKLV